MDILDQGQLQQLRAIHLAHDDGHGRQVGQAGGLQAAFAGDEPVATLLLQAHHERLQDAVLADRLRQLPQLLGREVGARLLRVGRYQVDIDFLQRPAGRGRLLGAAGQEGVEPPSESSSWLRHALTPTRSVSSFARRR